MGRGWGQICPTAQVPAFDYRMCSLTVECDLLLWSVEKRAKITADAAIGADLDYRMCSLTIGCALQVSRTMHAYIHNTVHIYISIYI